MESIGDANGNLDTYKQQVRLAFVSQDGNALGGI